MPGDALAVDRRAATARDARRRGRGRRVDLDHVRADLAEVVERHDVGLDHAPPRRGRPPARHGPAHARENVADLVDDGSFVEYAPLVVAAQRRRRSLAGADRAHAGRRARRRHRHGRRPADDRDVVRLHRARRHAGPVEPREEGPPLRAGRAHAPAGRVLHRRRRRSPRRHRRLRRRRASTASRSTTSRGSAGWCRSSASRPATASPGNAALLGCCDVIIATEGSNIGMGGPAMIEGGGLGVYEPTAIGPADVQTANGVDRRAGARRSRGGARREAVPRRTSAAAVDEWECADQRTLRHLIPENRVRAYDVRTVSTRCATPGSVLELRRGVRRRA